VQDGRQVAFESKKLNEMEQRWPTHEKEMWAMIHCLKTWGHYIGSKDVVVWTDNVTLKYFATQPKLSSKQARWQDTLALFNVDIRHKPGKENVVFDVLSRKHQLKVVYVGETKFQRKFDLGAAVMNLPRKGSKTSKRGSSPTSTCEMDYCGISKIDSMFQKEVKGCAFEGMS
jgi:hypothetical protein